MEGFQWNLTRIFIESVGIVGKVFKVMWLQVKVRQGRPWKSCQLDCSVNRWSDLNTNCSRKANWLRLQGHGFKGHGHRNVRGQRHAGQRYAIEDHLVSTYMYLSVVFMITQCLMLYCIRLTLWSSVVTMAIDHDDDVLRRKVGYESDETDWRITRNTTVNHFPLPKPAQPINWATQPDPTHGKLKNLDPAHCSATNN